MNKQRDSTENILLASLCCAGVKPSVKSDLSLVCVCGMSGGIGTGAAGGGSSRWTGTGRSGTA